MSYVLRANLTRDEFRELKVEAIRRDQDLQDLVTEALRTSPLTAAAFARAENGGDTGGNDDGR